MNFSGSTGQFLLDENGQRNVFRLKVVSLNRNGLENVGKWDTKRGLSIDTHIGFSNINHVVETLPSLNYSHLTVAVVLVRPNFSFSYDYAEIFLYIFYFKEKPYVSLRKDWFIQEGNDRYEGFCIDILRALAEMYNFNYTIYNVPDNKYGLPDENGKWNGLVKELIDGVIEKIRVV